MNNKQYAITVFSIIIAVICFLSSLFWIVMAKDLRNSVIILKQEKSLLEQEKNQLEWELEQVDQMICIDEVE